MDGMIDGLKKALMTGLGAASAAGERAEEIIRDLVQKGEMTVDQGKAFLEDLKDSLQEKKVEILRERPGYAQISAALPYLTAAERAALREALDALERTDG